MPRVALLIGLLAAGVALAGFVLLGGGGDPADFGPALVENDPFAGAPGRDEEFETRAAAGNSHVLSTPTAPAAWRRPPGGWSATGLT